MHRWLTIAAAAALTATGAAAQEMAVGGGTAYLSKPLNELDVDQDGRVDLGEFKMGFDAEHFFEDWDRNDDGYIDKSEYVTAHFAMIDLNKDGVIAKSEWDYSGRFWMEEDYPTGFDYWDLDNDGYIQREEFTERLKIDSEFALWDTDESDPGLTKEEVSAGMHGAWDRDRDGIIDEAERQQGPGHDQGAE